MTEDQQVTRVYQDFRGVDFRGDEINIRRSPDSLNVWKDYKETESIRTRPGLAQNVSFPDPVYGVFFFNGEMIVHSGTMLYKVVAGQKEVMLFSGVRDFAMNEALSSSFVYNNVLYIKDGLNYLQYDGETLEDVVGYIPTTTIDKTPNGGGSKLQDVNMLSEFRRNTFIADGKSKDFYLDAQYIDAVTEVLADGVPTDNYTVDKDKGCVKFGFAPSAPMTDGQSNVVITYRKSVDGYRDTILKCTLLQVFDNRVFFSGNPDNPNMIWHCGLEDPACVFDTDYYIEGLDLAKVRGMVAGNNNLWVFREPSSANTTIFYHTPSMDEVEGKVYPSVHSSVTTGCIGRAINFNDDIVFFSERGMEGISGDITTEQVLAHRSTTVDRKLTAEAGYRDMVLEEWEGYLFVFIGNKAYLADSRAMFTNENHNEYDWFYWEFDKNIICSCVQDGILYLGTEDGVYTLTDTEKAVESYWVTPKDKFKHPHKLKTTNKRGCVAEATGDVTVYAKIEDTDFEQIGTFENVTDYFVSRIKRKKFKDIQLKFHSMTRFSLESVTLECFVGGYIKR